MTLDQIGSELAGIEDDRAYEVRRARVRTSMVAVGVDFEHPIAPTLPLGDALAAGRGDNPLVCEPLLVQGGATTG